MSVERQVLLLCENKAIEILHRALSQNRIVPDSYLNWGWQNGHPWPPSGGTWWKLDHQLATIPSSVLHKNNKSAQKKQNFESNWWPSGGQGWSPSSFLWGGRLADLLSGPALSGCKILYSSGTDQVMLLVRALVGYRLLWIKKEERKEKEGGE